AFRGVERRIEGKARARISWTCLPMAGLMRVKVLNKFFEYLHIRIPLNMNQEFLNTNVAEILEYSYKD
ncbi:MAG: hypothetical protein QXU11_08150, partial [Thermoproteota archaeon]